MKKLLTLLTFLSLAFLANAQSNIFSPPWCITSAPPTFHPGPKGCRVAIDTNTQRLYIWKVGTTWVDMGDRIQHVIGCSAPLYVPNKWQSNVVYNDCNPRQLFVYQGAGVWDEIGADSPVITDATLAGDGSLSTPLKIAQQAATLNQVLKWNGTTWAPAADDGGTYTAGSGISIVGPVISNTGDLSATNELITDFEVTGGALVVSDAGGGHSVPVNDIAPVQDIAAGTGISLSGTDTRTITNTGDLSNTNELQNLSLTGQSLGISSGTGVTLPLIGVGAGTGISVSTASGSATVTNTAPSLWTDGGATTYLTATSDNLAIGATSSSSKLLVVSPSTSSVFAEFRNSLGFALLTIRENSNSTLNMTLGDAGGTGLILLSTSVGSSSYIATGGNVGINTSSPDRLFHAEASDAVTNSVTYPQRLTHITSGSATTGFGSGTEFELENGSGTNRVAATEEVTWTDAVDATEDATWKLRLIKNGAITDALTVLSSGFVGIGTSTPATLLNLKNGSIRIDKTDATPAVIGTYFNGSTAYGMRFEAASTSITSAPNGYLFQLGSAYSISHTSAGVSSVQIPLTFNPTSGTGIFNYVAIDNGVINQTGGANGITRGMLINTVLTSAADWRALEIATAGNKGIYQTSSIPTNNFAGKTAFGSTGTPTEMIDVTGNGKFSGTVTGTNLISTATVRLKGYTVATLPAGVVGDQAYVTDALAPAYGVTVVGGGSVVTPVFFDGTNWTAR